MITQSCASPGGTGIRPGFWFGEAERGQCAAGQQIRQPAGLLLRCAEVSDRVDAEPDGGFESDPERLVDPADLLDGDTQAGEVSRAAVLFGTAKPKQAEIAHELDRLERYLMSSIPVRDVGCEIARGEVSNRGPEVVVLLAKGERAGHDALSVDTDLASIA